MATRRKKLSSYLICLTPKWSCKQLVFGCFFALRRIAQIILSLSPPKPPTLAVSSHNMNIYDEIGKHMTTNSKPKNRNRNRRLSSNTTTSGLKILNQDNAKVFCLFMVMTGPTMRAFASLRPEIFHFNDNATELLRVFDYRFRSFVPATPTFN